MTDFLPEYSTMPLHGQYVGMFRLMDGAQWQQVRKNGEPDLCLTRAAALESARACVRAILNPPIRAEQKPRTGRDLIMEAQEARLKRQADGQRKAFGGVIVKGKLTKVEERSGAKRPQDRP